MNLYNDKILPRCMAWAMGLQVFRAQRERCLQGLSGRVLEIGFGAGHNLPFYPAQVEELLALEPSELSRALAKKRIAKALMPVTFVGLDGAQIPLDTASVDGIACTWTLCTIPRVEAALSEMRRVLKPGGVLHFVEHGLSEGARTARWQTRLNPLQRTLFGGCHLDRRVDALVETQFELERMERFALRGPKVLTSIYLGVARPRPRT